MNIVYVSFFIVILIVFSGMCSMIEAAILSLPLVRARAFAEEKRPGSREFLWIKEHIHTAISTIVILNNTINIFGAIIISHYVELSFGSHWLGIFSAVLTILIIAFAEVVPKTVGEYHKVPISLRAAPGLFLVIQGMRPLVALMDGLTSMVHKQESAPRITENEIKMLLKLGTAEGTVEVDEETLCRRIFRLNDLRAERMMKPLENVYALKDTARLIDVRQQILDSPYSRIIVYHENRSSIIGVCQQRVLLRELANDNHDAQVSQFMNRAIFVSCASHADDLLDKFRLHHQHLFVVRNLQKENIGIITMEDVLEELFGEIYDERDIERTAV